VEKFEEGTMEWDHHVISEGVHIPRPWGCIPTRVLAITLNAMGGPRIGSGMIGPDQLRLWSPRRGRWGALVM